MASRTGEKDKRSRVLLIVIISLLFLINAGLIYNLINKKNELTLTKEELVDTKDELADLEEIKAELDLEIENWKGQNEALDSVIDSKDLELRKKTEQIQKMLSGGKLTRRQLEKARREIEELKMYVNRYTNEIDSLSHENKYLKDEIYATKKDLDFEKERAGHLATEVDELSAKVKIGARLKAENLFATGIKEKRSGKEKETTRLSSADKIKVTFKLSKNDIAEKGYKTVYLKIITPSKATLSNQSAGSGTFNFKGEESLYTMKSDVNFQNKGEVVDFTWDKSNSMMDGEYEAYLFCEDHIIGKTTFVLN